MEVEESGLIWKGRRKTGTLNIGGEISFRKIVQKKGKHDDLEQREYCNSLYKNIMRLTYLIYMLHSVLFSHSVVSDSLWPQELQHARPPCPSPVPLVHPNLCPLCRWCHPTISSSVVPLLLLPSNFPNIRVFSNESALRIRWPKYWEFQLQHQSFQCTPRTDFF